MGSVNIEREWDRRIDCQICDTDARVKFKANLKVEGMTDLLAWTLMQKLTYKGALTKLGIKIKISR